MRLVDTEKVGEGEEGNEERRGTIGQRREGQGR